jgi:hypothetical protein
MIDLLLPSRTQINAIQMSPLKTPYRCCERASKGPLSRATGALENYLPVQSGSRLATKALAPSWASLLSSIFMNAGQVRERSAA